MKKLTFDTGKSKELELKDFTTEDLIFITNVKVLNGIDLFSHRMTVKRIFTRDAEGKPSRWNSFPISLGAYDIVSNYEVNLNVKIEDCQLTTLIVEGDSKIQYEITYETLIDRFLKIEKEEEDYRTNIAKEIQTWQNIVEKLYDEIENTFLKELKPYFNFYRDEINISENNGATYKIKKLKIELKKNGQSIQLIPYATFLIGAHGRIDVNINSAKHQKFIDYSLVLHRVDGKENWEFVEQDNSNIFNNRITKSELNKGKIEGLLENVIS